MEAIQIQFQPTNKQHEAWEILHDSETNILYYGGAACFVGKTIVRTNQGFKNIKDIVKGDQVLTKNKFDKLEYKTVLETFIYGGDAYNLILEFKLKNGIKIKCTPDHRFYYNGQWVEIQHLIKRVLESSSSNQWKILDKHKRKIENYKLEELWYGEGDEPELFKSSKEEISKDFNITGRKVCQRENSSFSRRVFPFKLSQKTASKSQRFQYSKQQFREFRMGYKRRKLFTLHETSIPELQKEMFTKEEFFKTFCELHFKKGRIKWLFQTKFSRSQRDKRKVQTKSLYSRNVSKRIQSKKFYNKRYSPKKELETHQIALNDIIEFKITYENTKLYDLHVKDNNNFFITEEEILVHNSGGKTYLACAWLIIKCLEFQSSRWFIGRDKLNTILKSTMNTFRDISRDWGLVEGTDWKVNELKGIIKFFNGSEIYLLDLHHNPTDINFDRLGSMEFTGGFLEEVAEIARKGYEIVNSRIRYKLDEFNTIPKLLIVSNPTKNWVYTDFYLPFEQNNLPKSKKFLRALPTDNPHTSKHYLESLKNLNEVDKQRLLYGNFNYDDDDRALISFSKIMDCFTNDFVECGKKYLVSDLAMQGRDKFIITIWDGLRCDFVLIKNKSSGKEIEEDIKTIANKYQISRSNILADSDGMGSYLSSYIQGINEFHGGSSAFNKEEYKNLKSECAFKLAELINQDKLYIKCPNEVKSLIVEELGQLKRDNIDKDEMKKHIVKKEEMKENINRSPDFLDCLIMRMWFEVKPQFRAKVIKGFNF